MRRKIIAGNWKMNKTVHETADLVNALKERLKAFRDEVDIVVCPPYASLVIAGELLSSSSIRLGAQNISQYDDGAYTGEVSAKMLLACGCRYVIVGHSERRQYFHETDDLVNLKARKALTSGLVPIICVGETLEEREKGVTDLVITAQIKGVLQGITAEELQKLVIAYEPVWAIGTGKNATPGQANEVHRLIRKLVGQLYSWASAEKLQILYGGSMNPQNAASLLSQPEIDGGLIGGASLKPESFVPIVQAGIESLGPSSH